MKEPLKGMYSGMRVNFYHGSVHSHGSHFRPRAAYVELVRAIGPDVFDDVPDRFNIKGLIAQAQQIDEQLANI